MRTIAVSAILLLAACDGGGAQDSSELGSQAMSGATTRPDNVRVTLPATPGGPGAGYFTVTSFGPPLGSPPNLVEVSSAAAERIELHETLEQGGMMSMRPIASVPMSADVRFEPGGKHLMLFGLRPNLKPGDRIPLTFRFDRGIREVTVQAEVRAAGGGGSHGSH